MVCPGKVTSRDRVTFRGKAISHDYILFFLVSNCLGVVKSGDRDDLVTFVGNNCFHVQVSEAYRTVGVAKTCDPHES